MDTNNVHLAIMKKKLYRPVRIEIAYRHSWKRHFRLIFNANVDAFGMTQQSKQTVDYHEQTQSGGNQKNHHPYQSMAKSKQNRLHMGMVSR